MSETKAPETKFLKIEDITVDQDVQSRHDFNEAVAREYGSDMGRGIVFPPVIVYFDGTTYWLAEGFHRIRGAAWMEMKEILAGVHQGDKKAALLHSLGANLGHGLQRSNKDKRKAAYIMLKDPEWSTWSSRRIADHIRVSKTFVEKLKKELVKHNSPAASGNGCHIEKAVKCERGGKEYTMVVEHFGDPTSSHQSDSLYEISKRLEANSNVRKDKLIQRLNRQGSNLIGRWESIQREYRHDPKVVDCALAELRAIKERIDKVLESQASEQP